MAISPSFFGINASGQTARSANFDSGHAALLKTLGVTDGYWLTSRTGQLVAHDGAFAYAAVIAELKSETPPAATPVPEPETYALMLAGLGSMGFFARTRRGLAPADGVAA